MVTVETITGREEIERYVPLCRELACESGCHLPFQGLRHPLVWWDHFNNADGTDFKSKRGTNFLGVRSRLEKLFLLAARNGQGLCGVVPLVEYSVETAGLRDAVRVITLPGDFFIPYQDFTVSPGVRGEAVAALLGAVSELLGERGLAVLPYVPEGSPNVPHIREGIEGLSSKGLRCTAAVTGRRGGVRPWTIEPIVSVLRQITDQDMPQSPKDAICALIGDLKACPPMNLLFPGTRRGFEGRIEAVIGHLAGTPAVAGRIGSLRALLEDEALLYPFIRLPGDRQAYLGSLGKSSKANFHLYTNRFTKASGSFEKLTSPEITDADIDDCLRIHSLRWGENSVSLRNESSHGFLKDLCRQLSLEGSLTLFFARYQGRRIASHSCIDVGGRREAYLIGRDPLFDETRASRLLYLHTILDAIEGGFHTYDLGLGWHAYKMSFTKTCSRTLNFFISPGVRPLDLSKLFLGYECMIPLDGEWACRTGRDHMQG
ncbi:MAG TPA: GNAT family N-acetyltransferase [Deltaproteobacteria bacterium]|jgi:hypothetical protein|nr:GNAT family N-acetyltransferase [Deltaproteobacteria bacterium]